MPTLLSRRRTRFSAGEVFGKWVQWLNSVRSARLIPVIDPAS